MTRKRLIALELEDKASQMVLIVKSGQPETSTDMDFLRKISILGLIHGFHAKMVDDTINNVNRTVMNYKKRKKILEKLANDDRLFIECNKVKKYAMTIMKEFSVFVSDPDLKQIWLVIDRFLEENILEHTLLTAVNTFIGIIDDIGNFGSCYPELVASIMTVSKELSDELMQEKQKTYIQQGIDDPDFVFECFEHGDLKRSAKAADLFFDIFSVRDKFNKYAEKHFKKMPKEKHESFQRVIEQNNIN